jgi:hypothetical protein
MEVPVVRSINDTPTIPAVDFIGFRWAALADSGTTDDFIGDKHLSISLIRCFDCPIFSNPNMWIEF